MVSVIAKPMVSPERVSSPPSPAHSSSGSSEPTAIQKSIPDEFYCPISHMMMERPVIAADGYTYERSEIERWFTYKLTSPMINLPVSTARLQENRELQARIHQFSKAYPQLVAAEQQSTSWDIAITIIPSANEPTAASARHSSASRATNRAGNAPVGPRSHWEGLLPRIANSTPHLKMTLCIRGCPQIHDGVVWNN